MMPQSSPTNGHLTFAKNIDKGLIGVYAIYLRGNPSVAYIGSSVNIRARLMAHLNKLKKSTHGNYKLKGLFKRHGEESFMYRVLSTFKTEPEARKFEQVLLDFLPKNTLYNLDKRVVTYARKRRRWQQSP